MFEIRSIESGPIAALDIANHLVHKSYFPAGRLAKGDRIVVEVEGSVVVGTDPAIPQGVNLVTWIDFGTGLNQHLGTIGLTVSNAQSPNWFRAAIGFVIAADGFLYHPSTQVQFTPLAGPVTNFNVVGQQELTPSEVPIIAGITGGTEQVGKSTAVFDLNIAHRISAFIQFTQIQADNIYTPLTGRTRVYQPANGNTAGE